MRNRVGYLNATMAGLVISILKGGRRVKFEISNPSDKAFVESDNFETACLAICILGGGHYGLKQVDGDKRMPIFILGGCDEFFKETFNKSFEESINSANKSELAKVLETVSLAGERSSMNNIVKSAGQYAKALREAEAK
jgi:hypothetical protein